MHSIVLQKKQKLSTSKSQEAIEQITQEINHAISTIASTTTTNSDHKSILKELKSKFKEASPLTQLEFTQKELNIAFSKYTKLLEKQFNPDISKSYRNVDFDLHTVNQIIAGHLYREGFLEMYKIIESMKSRDLVPALNWATANRDGGRRSPRTSDAFETDERDDGEEARMAVDEAATGAGGLRPGVSVPLDICVSGESGSGRRR